MNLIISADDYGLTASITRQILDCYDNGALSSVSIMANGAAFDYAIQEYLKRPSLRLSVHLNIFEGTALSGMEKVKSLIGPNNEFRRSFVSLWLLHARGSKREKAALKKQIKEEFSAQIRRVKNFLRAGEGLCVDGHQHVHLIPFVFDALMELQGEFDFTYVRTLKEPMVKLSYLFRSMQADAGANALKHLLLNALSERAHAILSRAGIASCDRFGGVLFSGRMSLDFAKDVMDSASRKGALTTEILFHPFQAAEAEQGVWSKRRDLMAYYCSPQRRSEAEAVKNPVFKETIKSYGQ